MKIVLDTETTNTIEEPLAYDIGWAVVDDNGKVALTRSYAIAEIFLDKDLMAIAYFADKIPSYWQEIENGERILARLSTIRKTLINDCKAFGVKEIYCHNARFDDLSLKLTQRYLTGSKYRYFIPYDIIICDTLKMSRQAFGNDEKYIAFCKSNGYLTSRNQVRLTAEIIYRFLTQNNNFAEEHKGLDDVLIEKEILAECIKRGIVDGALWSK